MYARIIAIAVAVFQIISELFTLFKENRLRKEGAEDLREQIEENERKVRDEADDYRKNTTHPDDESDILKRM